MNNDQDAYWYRVEIHYGNKWHADDDHDTPEQAERRKAQLAAQGLTTRVRKVRGA